tara:strand:- start:47 stop:829 length:783 start_codon:yes stop_codon:yes gene_type:complete
MQHEIVSYLKLHDIDLFMALIIAVIGVVISYLTKKTLTSIVAKRAKNKTAKFFIVNLVYMFLLAIVLIMVLNKLGVPTNSLLAVLGASSLAIALALKDSLSNVAAGIMIVFEKPFSLNDNIETNGVSGKVVSLSLYNTRIKTPNNDFIYIPNGKLISDKIINKSVEKTRRLSLSFYIDHQSDIEQTKTLINETIANNAKALTDQPYASVVKSIDLSGVLINTTVWAKMDDYATLENELLQSIHEVLTKNQIVFAEGQTKN